MKNTIRSIRILAALLVVMLLCAVGAACAEDQSMQVRWFFDSSMIYEGSELKELLDMKSLLRENGFYADNITPESETFNTGMVTYDDMKAVESLCKLNDLSYNPEGITWYAWYRISGQEGELLTPAKPLPADTSLLKRITGHMTKKTNVFGMAVPMFALWIAGFVLLLVIVVLVMKLMAPASDKGGNGEQVPHTRRDGLLLNFIISYEGETRTYMYDLKNAKEKQVIIGRNTGADSFPLFPGDREISKKHCTIYAEGGQLLLHDHSSNGTILNGTRLGHEKIKLASGDIIRIGRHSITVKF